MNPQSDIVGQLDALMRVIHGDEQKAIVRRAKDTIRAQRNAIRKFKSAAKRRDQ